MSPIVFTAMAAVYLLTGALVIHRDADRKDWSDFAYGAMVLTWVPVLGTAMAVTILGVLLRKACGMVLK